IRASRHGLRHDRLHLLRHHADIGFVAADIAEAIEAEPVVEPAEQNDVVLERDIGPPAAATTATAAATTATTGTRSAANGARPTAATTTSGHAGRAAAALNALAAAIGLRLRPGAGLDVRERRVALGLARPLRRLLAAALARPLGSLLATALARSLGRLL